MGRVDTGRPDTDWDRKDARLRRDRRRALPVVEHVAAPGGFFGVGARWAGATQGGLLMSGFVVLYYAALGFLCQGIGRAIQELDAMRSPQVPAAAPIDSDCNGSVRCSGGTGGSIPHRMPAQHL